MKKGLWLASMLAAFLLAAGAAQAQGVDQKISALEQELQQLKESQIELKKEATAAAAAMPTFEYRPGAGMTITGADQSWAFRFGHEFTVDLMKLEGSDNRREGDLGFFLRRNRPQITYSIDRGFWEYAFELDVDGDETGDKSSIIQRACMRARMSQLNPWLPDLQFGIDCSGAGSRYRSSEMTFELPTLDRNNGFNTGSHVGTGLSWGNLPAFGLPGNQQFNYYLVQHGMGRGDGLRDESNKLDHVFMWNINPLNQSKNKWVSGIGFSMFGWFGNIDDRTTTNGSSTRTFQLRSQEGSRRVAFFTSPTAIDGNHHMLSPSAQYKVGPYQLNLLAQFDRYTQEGGRKKTVTNSATAGTSTGGGLRGTAWKLMNDLMVWSPKGFLTGAPNQAGTLGFGYSFERTWMSCGARVSATVACDNSAVSSGQTRNRLIVNEWGVRYWIRPAMSVHFVVKHYNVDNTPSQVQRAIGCTGSRTGSTDGGKDCSFTDAVLRFAFTY